MDNQEPNELTQFDEKEREILETMDMLKKHYDDIDERTKGSRAVITAVLSMAASSSIPHSTDLLSYFSGGSKLTDEQKLARLRSEAENYIKLKVVFEHNKLVQLKKDEKKLRREEARRLRSTN